ncbi:FecR domain-containing protein [Reichenbachiella sp. MALMAid0571]|uniref:FecR family protein n=1 Tax=Reichenbachiella sp. MALMAid0571 TaxID=3143939 RepID=UPI0032DEE294
MKDTVDLQSLFDKFLKDECSDEELKVFFDHIKDQPISDELNPLLEDVWEKLKKYPSLKPKHSKQLLEKIFQKDSPKKSQQRWLTPLKIAVSIAAVLVLAFFVGIQSDNQESEVKYITKTTQIGQRASYKLSDGSMVFLNAGSSISFPEIQDEKTRKVILAGEAFFEVVKNSEKPFVVESANLKTQVLGTSFNIRAYPQKDIEVTVVTGKVQVESLSTETQGNEKILLTPNEQAVYSRSQNRLSFAKVDARKSLAWHSKELLFENVDMREVLSMLEIRFDQKIILDNSGMGNCIIRKAKYEKESLETILKGLQSLLDFKYEFNGYNQWTIYGKGCQ